MDSNKKRDSQRFNEEFSRHLDYAVSFPNRKNKEDKKHNAKKTDQD
ncbi:hypothetical protein GCM10011391_11900 [Pullulanibacillus camelliae]|uniref:Uncharacterized protein n=1 Tax=Pullulanibacillus camelliae TaxID=1707096 RepID=A0A8J2YGB3_9BACL|nr:hypothetical protein [Pullulanibacillus camelliae]GGE34871.1 hypothetical protein GCM10011391_11900 [Pullulanibacillus camelliae]